MEMFAEGFTNKRMFQDAKGNYTDCHDWGECVAEDGALINFTLNGKGEVLQGALNTYFLLSSIFTLKSALERIFDPSPKALGNGFAFYPIETIHIHTGHGGSG